ncbi:MAG: ArsR/SmtB family transcription factor [Pseudobdellovibrionaceae bacterium]
MKRQIKDAIYGHLATLTKALSSPKRIEIIDLLCQGEKTVESISEQAVLGLKNASAQLKELKAARLVESRKDGKYVYYRIADPSVARFWIKLRTFGNDRITEIQNITQEALSGPEALEQMNRKTLLTKAKRGDVVLIDVRPSDEYEAGHLPFAISVPVSEISKHLKAFSKKKEIVAYCRGPYCFFAKDAVDTLRKHGYKAYNLKDSVHDWSEHGLPIERTIRRA